MVEAIGGPVGQIEAFLALGAVEIGAFEAFDALEGAAVAIHRVVGCIE